MGCMERYIEHANFADTGFSYTMSLISGKHKMVILYCLMDYEPVRFNEMKRYLGNITAGSRPADRAQGISADPAESGIFSFGAGQVANEGVGPALCVGREKPPVDELR